MIDKHKNLKAPKSDVGILFVHGIGEQNKGDTLLAFADPLVRWISRGLDAIRPTAEDEKNDEPLSKVWVEENSPRELLLEHKNADDTVTIRESWWAYNFRAPDIRELSWWLLLVGTWVTLSHASKPLIDSVRSLRKSISVGGLYAMTIAFFRFAFFYTPMAITFQLVVILLTVLASIPLLPFSESLTKLMLTLSRTLGDSYLLNHSPIQRRMAIDNVRNDIASMLEKCERINVVAHSQGAAISYFALKEMVDADLIEQDKVKFISVGSGLDKIYELEKLSSTLEFAKTNRPPGYVRLLYFLPAAFALFWAVIMAGIASYISLTEAIMIDSILIFTLWIAALSMYKYLPSNYHLSDIKWIDIYASSDPVSNGAIEGPTGSYEIINSRSLITDHTTYFSNYTDFLPLLAKQTLVDMEVSWMKKMEKWIDTRAGSFGWVKRSIRKHCLMCGNWINRIGFITFLFLHSDSLSAKTETDLLGRLGAELDKLLTSDIDGFLQILWIKALGLFFLTHLILRWADYSADRSADNMFFSSDFVLKKSVQLLTLSLLLLPTLVWLLFLLPVS